MEQLCESCGQQLPHDDAEVDGDDDGHNGVWLGSSGAARPSKPAAMTGRRGASKASTSSGRDTRLLLGLAAFVLAWGAFVGIGRLTSPDSSLDEQAAADIEERAAREAAAAAVEGPPAGEAAVDDAQVNDARSDEAPAEDSPALAEGDIGDYAGADAAPGFPVADPDAEEFDEEFDDLGGVGRSQRDDFIEGLNPFNAVTPEIDELRQQFEGRGNKVFVAYRAVDGLVLIDLAQGLAEGFAVSAEAPAPRGAKLLRLGPETFAFDPLFLTLERVRRGQSFVVAESRDGASYAVAARNQADGIVTINANPDGPETSFEFALADLQLLAVDGLGLLAVPGAGTGETLIATAEGFVFFSPNRVLAGAADVVLEQVCPASGRCALELVNLTLDERIAIPDSFVRFGDTYSVSPDGQALLRRSPTGFAEILMIENNVTLHVADAGVRHVAWGPTADFILWFGGLDAPTLEVVFLDERRPLTIDLRDFGGPLPIGPELAAFPFAPVDNFGPSREPTGPRSD